MKQRPDGLVDKYKALIVARGFTQQHGIDYGDTFSPVVKPEIVCGPISCSLSRMGTPSD
jgi:histone deacetylase 1/2